MEIEIKNTNLLFCETEARSKLKSQFELFSQPLPTEADLFAMWEGQDVVLVSIACATFEHGSLLDDAIRSFLLQRTGFRFEIMIRDDASTDGTRDVIAYYLQHYPHIVRARMYDENQFKLGRRPADDWFALTRGKYIALCEGDDFWIDRDKLKDQVAQLERHPDCVISVAGTLCYNVMKDNLKEMGLVEVESIHSGIPPQYHHTSTLLIERQALVNVTAKQKKYNVYGDTALRLLLVEDGKCICLPRLVSVYWINGAGIWTSLGEEQMKKANALMMIGLIRAAEYRNKISLLHSFFYHCSIYFPISLRDREWRLVAICSFPFAVRKTRNLVQWVSCRLGIKREK